jgi:hypothetical protein
MGFAIVCMLAGAVPAGAQPTASPALSSTAQTDSIDGAEIMRRMAANMESAADERRHYVYQQKVKARLTQANGRLARQEIHEYVATPGLDRTTKELVSLTGEYHRSKSEIIRYSEPGFKKGGLDPDGELMEDMVRDLVNSKNSKDGVPHSLFPMSTRDLPACRFTLRRPWSTGVAPHTGWLSNRQASLLTA